MKILSSILYWFRLKTTQSENLILFKNYNSDNNFDVDVFFAINKERENIGAYQLDHSKQLSIIAFNHCLYMVSKGVPSHDYFVSRSNLFPNNNIGETVTFGCSEPDVIVQSFLKSPSHKITMLDKKYRKIGIANAIDDDGKKYVTVIYMD